MWQDRPVSNIVDREICIFFLQLHFPGLWLLNCRRLILLSIYTRGIDKSLARPGRKQATASKLRVYSTYPLRSSIQVLARCSNFFKSLKKNSKSCPSNPVSAATMTSASDEKWWPFNCISVEGTNGSPKVPDPENRVDDQDIGIPGRSISSGLQVPIEQGHCRTRTRPPWVIFPRRFSFKMHQQRWVILRVDRMALWKIIN